MIALKVLRGIKLVYIYASIRTDQARQIPNGMLSPKLDPNLDAAIKTEVFANKILGLKDGEIRTVPGGREYRRIGENIYYNSTPLQDNTWGNLFDNNMYFMKNDRPVKVMQEIKFRGGSTGCAVELGEDGILYSVKGKPGVLDNKGILHIEDDLGSPSCIINGSDGQFHEVSCCIDKGDGTFEFTWGNVDNLDPLSAALKGVTIAGSTNVGWNRVIYYNKEGTIVGERLIAERWAALKNPPHMMSLTTKGLTAPDTEERSNVTPSAQKLMNSKGITIDDHGFLKLPENFKVAGLFLLNETSGSAPVSYHINVDDVGRLMVVITNQDGSRNTFSIDFNDNSVLLNGQKH
jgi:hypothetical protein